jgi:hypothetical protein
VLNYREPQKIVDSIVSWRSLHRRLYVSEIPSLPRGVGYKTPQLMTWIENHFDACRKYFGSDERFLEVDIESTEAPKLLGSKLGIEISGWGDYKPSRKNPMGASRHA